MSVDETVGWEGRKWLESYTEKHEKQHEKQNKQKKSGGSIRFCSYHVYAQSGMQYLRHVTVRTWEQRRATLSLEIESYNADVICLQDCDHFHDFWKNCLSLLGYDTVFKQRTEVKNSHEEGVVIAFKRNLFQLFKTIPIELNDALEELDEDDSDLRMRITTDDVGLLLFLQPWEVINGTQVQLISLMILLITFIMMLIAMIK